MSAINKLRNKFLVFVLFGLTFIRLTITRARFGAPISEPQVASQGSFVETPAGTARARKLLTRWRRTRRFPFDPAVQRTIRLSTDSSVDQGRSFDVSQGAHPSLLASGPLGVANRAIFRQQRRNGRLYTIRGRAPEFRVGFQATGKFPFLRVIPVATTSARVPVQLAALTRPVASEAADLRGFSIDSDGAILEFAAASVMPVAMLSSGSCPPSSSSCWSCSGSSCGSCSSASGSGGCSSCACASCGGGGSCGSCGSCGGCGGCSSCSIS